jgi:4a-hydroxytetrahydrobiopterin dehydratase
MEKYSQEQINTALEKVSGWSVNADGELTKQFEFDNFGAAMTFVNKIAEVAEELQHHPDILIKYNKVRLTVLTHDLGNALTELDFKLAERANAI